jgi:hypothetical protein
MTNIKNAIQNQHEQSVKTYVYFEKSRLKLSKKHWSVYVYINKKARKIGSYATKEIAEAVVGFIAEFPSSFIDENKEILRNQVREWANNRFNLPQDRRWERHFNQFEKPVGTERISATGYIEVKVAGRKRWVRKNILVWEAAHGKVPENFAVAFKDNNPFNCALDNLELIHLCELGFRNWLTFYCNGFPDELRATVEALALLRREIKKKGKTLKEREKTNA